MGEDWINRIVARETLSERLTRASTENGMAHIEALLGNQLDSDDARDRPSLLDGAGRLRELQTALKPLVSLTYNVAKMSILVPSGLWGLSKGIAAPDLDIRFLGIGRHRFFLFHSALGLVVLRRLYRMWVESTEDKNHLWPYRVVHKVTGAALGAYAVGVGIKTTVPQGWAGTIARMLKRTVGILQEYLS